MDYKIAICDDNEADVRYIKNLVDKWAGENKLSVNINIFDSAESFLFQYEDDRDYDILLLDIEMKKIDGVTLAKKVRKSNETVQIVFITGYADYILEGYDVAALHYLMKPVGEDRLFDVLERAVYNLKKNERALRLELSDSVVKVPFYEIRYLEVNKNYVTVHGKSDYTIKRTLGEFEKELDERFYRAGRSFIINLTYIQKVTRTEVFLTDGSIIPLPRGQYEPLNRAIIGENTGR